MRIGNFWGLPVPMILVVFDGKWDLLRQYLTAFNTGSNLEALFDIQREFIALEKACNVKEYSLPEYDKVSRSVSPIVKIDYGKAKQGSDFVESLITEISLLVVEKILTKEKNEKFYNVPDDLRNVVANWVFEHSFNIGEINSVVNKIVNSFEKAEESSSTKLVEKFNLKVKPCDYVYSGVKRVEVTDSLKAVWTWFYKRLDVIHEYASNLNSVITAEDVTFDIPFFDLIKRKPISLKYKVIEIFDSAKEKQTYHLISKCINECKEELKKYKTCMQSYVTLDSFQNIGEILTTEAYQKILAIQSDDCIAFFERLRMQKYFCIEDLLVSDFEMLVQIYKLIEECDDVSKVFGIEEDICLAACDIGICGLNNCSLDLFAKAIADTSIVSRGKVQKTQKEIDEINAVISDIEALLSTLTPVGEVLV